MQQVHRKVAPHVTGMLALLKQLHPKKTNVQLRTLLPSYTVDLGAKGKDPQFGYGRVQYIPQSSFFEGLRLALSKQPRRQKAGRCQSSQNENWPAHCK
ncbi:S8 family serine peptidase [Bacillus sp. SL00103]